MPLTVILGGKAVDVPRGERAKGPEELDKYLEAQGFTKEARDKAREAVEAERAKAEKAAKAKVAKAEAAAKKAAETQTPAGGEGGDK